MIIYSCPTCGECLEAEDHCASQKHSCPHCQQRLQIPPPSGRNNKTVLGKPLVKDNKTVLGIPLDKAVILEVADEKEGRRWHQKRRQYSFECPRCGSKEDPQIRKETAAVGWILFVILLLFFFPLCWLGIFVRVTWEVCWDCAHRVHKEGPTISFD